MTEPFEHRREIAVIGLACRFPGAQNSDQFWANLRDGVESISRFTDEELLASGIAPEVLGLPNYVKAGGVLPDIELFDAGFFGISRREAEMTDPQQRIFLEVAWEGLENAGYDPQTYNGSIGVFAGSSISTYLLFNLLPDVSIVGSGEHFPTLIGNDKDYLATHVSYKLNLHGPSMSIQTACSTSLVAIHTACQSLLNGECDIAIAGGVAVSVPQQTGYVYQEGAYFSPDGSCRSFSADARGTVFGSGAGVVVLKRLEDALRDGDCIDAIVKGSAINNDGAGKVGFTAPSVAGQARAISEALAITEVDPETIGYIEAHGTATPLGDPIEISALSLAFSSQKLPLASCAIGSVKSNVGHLDSAAGVCGFIKTVLSLKHAQIPPSLHCSTPNPDINFGR
ncbi:MAG TPA: polyketide synthase, partial [Pyrinomonadaceae bacterium]|nr:polyketide synthase [Pyrinomonadaceae bacterium]